MIQIHYYILKPKNIRVRKLWVTMTQGHESAKVKFKKWFKKHYKVYNFEIIEIY